MFSLINVIIFFFLFLIINHFLFNNKENFECDLNLDAETCFKKTQKSNSVKINNAKSLQKVVSKSIDEVKKLRDKLEARAVKNRKAIVGLESQK